MTNLDTLNQAAGESAGGYTGWRRELSLALLVLVNLLPLAGVLWFDWDVGALMILYWSENLIIGFYTLVRILVVAPLGGIFAGLFFTVHYGGFCAVHGMFIVSMLFDSEMNPLAGDSWPFFLVFVQLLVNVVRQVLELAPPEWLVAFAGLALSHGASFVANFLLGGERRRLSVGTLMGSPYGRVMILHVTIIGGSFAVLALGQPLVMLLVLIALKLGVDIIMHLREHRKLAARG
ncbi:MAG: DUF6498-containing protein [Pseudomonadota bacterium]